MPPPIACPSTWSWGADVAKALVGTFVGAGLAFWANRAAEGRQLRRNNLAAGNVALSVLSRQFGDFVIFRAAIQAEATERKDFPDWLQFQPSLFAFSESLVLDLKSLTFLFEHARGDLLARLVDAEARYHDLRKLLAMNTEACKERDDAIAKAGLVSASLMELRRFEAAVDAPLRGKLSTLNAALKRRAKNELDNYRSVGRGLRELMLESYKTTEVMTFIAMGAQKDLEDKPWALE
jgi:hypothetical protein